MNLKTFLTIGSISAGAAVSAANVFQIDFNTDSQQTLHSRDTTTKPIKNEFSELLFNFTLGTPEQSFVALLSNAYGDILVNSYDSDLCSENSPSSYYCSQYGYYNYSASSAFIDLESTTNFSVLTNGLTASGFYIDETLKFGDGLEFDDVKVGVLFNSTLGIPVFGIGYPVMEGLYQTTNETYDNFPMLLKKKGLTKSISYSIWSESIDINKNHKGTILFGGIDKAKYKGDFITVPFQPFEGKAYPDIQVDSISLNSGDNQNEELVKDILTTVSITNGYSFFPTPVWERILELTSYKFDSNNGYYTGDCIKSNDTLSFKFSLDGEDKFVTVKVSDLTQQLPNSDSCFLQANDIDKTDEMTLSILLFANSYYSFFDLENDTVSFAPLSFSTESNIEEISSDSGSSSDSDSSSTTTTITTTSTSTSSSQTDSTSSASEITSSAEENSSSAEESPSSTGENASSTEESGSSNTESVTTSMSQGSAGHFTTNFFSFIIVWIFWCFNVLI